MGVLASASKAGKKNRSITSVTIYTWNCVAITSILVLFSYFSLSLFYPKTPQEIFPQDPDAYNQ